MHLHVLMRDEKRKGERSKQDQTNNVKQHSTPVHVVFGVIGGFIAPAFSFILS